MRNCSFTGHRIIDEKYIKPLEELLVRAIDYVYSQGCRNFYCGGAIGFDTMAAKAVISARMKKPDMRLIIVIPCKSQADKWSERERSVYEFVLASADEVVYVSEEYTDDCMRRRNQHLVDVCDVLIAFSGKARSGSAQTVRMAVAKERIVYNLHTKISNCV